MQENLVGYLLGNLDEAGNRQVEAYLHSHADARQTLIRLKRALSPLAADRDEIAPPPGLAARTLAMIAGQGRADLPRAPREPAVTSAIRPSRWRRADMLVVAGLLVLVLGAGVPVIYGWHRERGKLACQDNLRQFFVALAAYRDQRNAYPDLSREAPLNVAGLVVPVLADAGVLSDSFSVRCPEVGPHLSCPLTLARIREMPPDAFQTQAPNLALCYAFTLGYRDVAGDYCMPWHQPASSLPILADRPPSAGCFGNSINHGGAGQNVLFLDGHVRFATQRTIGDPNDDIFMNNDNLVAAGVGAHDNVLGYSAARP